MVVDETGALRRRRAPAMSPEQRRTEIIRSTLPLLATHGLNVTTSQIAKAAGIAEGTVFRAFADKTELINACVEAALRVDELVDQLTAIPQAGPLTDRLAAAVGTMDAYFFRMGSVLSALATTGYRLDEAKHRAQTKQTEDLAHLRPVLTAVAELLGADGARLRVPTDQAVRFLFGLVVSSGLGRTPQQLDQAEIDDIVGFFLHGALTH
ncbi:MULTISPECIES: TetR/AcrR family transcriptional regulator [unclassified Crossiella]|uniref:TetR/AcrR family transcriptional regulator n=1 Tax=unclassified Crossiella TaxID=2620835 RepID=UPI001FFE59DC|nr:MULTISPECIES: TetR/AcrR family transcriptional regulator [unclassified Crossiella]MCK2241219.1 TetR/AcrR family transcriptional regulator [Crossiella sp. S99.2]MCK2253637.1 TetR/AcrR family transcriptional regulator [Crossiella sp. S99.1]